MDFDKTKLLAAIAILLIISFAMSFAVYNKLPEEIITHWDSLGEANGVMSKDVGLFLVPVLGIIITIVMLAIPLIDPLKKNIHGFIKYYNMFILIMLGFLLYIHAITILINLGYDLNISQLIGPAIGVLLFFAGILIGHVKKNYMIGIRTPWTLASKEVWDKTHQKGRTLFKASGIICFFGLIFPNYAMWFILAPIIISVIYLFAYSCVEFKNEEKK